MLYDNAQLISLYAEAYTWHPDPLYKKVVAEIIEFSLRELTSPEHGFYSALDADSEGKEGKFYIFTKDEIADILGPDAELFCIYYHITEDGNWEEEQSNVLFRRESDDDLAQKLGLTVGELVDKISLLKQKVFEARSTRVRPGLDNKILASWNGLMLKGLCDAYRVFNDKAYLDIALKNAGFILENLVNNDSRLVRIFKKQGSDGSGVAFLDDYANIIDALITLYEVTFDEQWLMQAQKLADSAIAHYYDKETGNFFYTADDDEQLIARKSEIMDSVTPASNSVMARNLKKLGLFFYNEEYSNISTQLLRNIFQHLTNYPSAYSNWIMLLQEELFGIYEVAITGVDADSVRREIENNYIPNKIILGGKAGSLPLLQDKFGSVTQIFVCKDKTCGLPAYNIADAIKQIQGA